MRITRRGFLGSSALLAGCAARRNAATLPPLRSRLAPVIVSSERVIRTVAGLRPFRPSGFVVRAEKLARRS